MYTYTLHDQFVIEVTALFHNFIQTGQVHIQNTWTYKLYIIYIDIDMDIDTDMQII